MESPYTNTTLCVERLINTYRKHKTIIVAVDFDSTVYPWEDPKHTFDNVLQLLRDARSIGCMIVVYTAGTPNRYAFMEEYLESHGIPVDSINKNPIPLTYGLHGKIFYNILLDDRAGLGQACEILQQTIALIRNEKTPT